MPLFILILLVVTGCARLDTTTPLPPPMKPHPVVRGITGDASLSPDGRRLVSIRDDRLTLTDLMSGDSADVDTIPADAKAKLSWSPDSRQFAVTGERSGGGFVALYRDGSGPVQRWELETIPGRGGWISEREFLLPTVKSTVYRFGVNLRQTILRLTTGDRGVKETPLHDTTVLPSTYGRLATKLSSLFVTLPHPLGDLVLLTRLHDPPEFEPYRAVLTLHLESGTQRELGKLSIDSPPPSFTGQDDQVVMPGDGFLSLLDPWSGTQSILSERGAHGAVSSRPGTWCMGGLLTVDGKKVTEIPPDAIPLFDRRGERLVVIDNGTAFTIDLPPRTSPHPPLTDQQKSRLRELRSLRAQGLITPDDFRLVAGPLLEKLL